MLISLEIYILLTAFCTLASFIFSFSEMALSSVSQASAERILAGRGPFNRNMKFWIEHPNRILATILVGNTIANTMSAIFISEIFELAHPGVSPIWIGAAWTLVILVSSEITPKIIARAYADSTAALACSLMTVCYYLLYPITIGITSSVNAFLRMLGLITQRVESIQSSDLEYLVHKAHQAGSIERDKSKILSSVFQFSKRRVKEIMIPKDKICAIPVDANLMEVLDIVRRENHSRYPVYNQNIDRIVGFLHARDMFAVLKSYGFSEDGRTNLQNFSLRTSLRRAFFVPEQALISRVLNEMKSNRVHLALVKDEWGNVVGLVTLEDILEEVFGEIHDEHDEAETIKLQDLYSSGIEVEGSETVLDLRSKYGVDLEESESYTTVNGFLQHYAAHQNLTPKMVIIWKNYVFSIQAVKEGEVERVLITEIPQSSDE